MKEAKTIGDFVALVHFHKEVVVEIPVKVIAENAPAVEEKKPVKAAPVVEETAVVEEEAPVVEETEAVEE